MPGLWPTESVDFQVISLTYEPAPGSDERHWVWTWEDDEWLAEEAD
jgi:hypothetical protein